MAPSPENKSFITNAKEAFDEGNSVPSRDARNRKNLEAAQKLGLTESAIISQHPEVAQAAAELEETKANTSRTLKWVTAVSSAVGAAVPLLMFKKSQGLGKWVKRGVAAIFTGGGAGLAGGLISNAALDKENMKKYAAFQDAESAAIERDVASLRAAALTPAPDALAFPGKEFTAGMTPRDASHAAQAAKDALQRNTPVVGA